MDDYNSVPPPDAQIDQNAAIQDAMARAKQIAARLQNSAPGAGVMGAPLDGADARKRTGEDAGLENGAAIAKRPAPGLEAPPGGDPKQVAMQVAQSIAQRAGLGSMVVEDIKIPNKFVGLIIGRGGEMITKLQSETSARIQVAPGGTTQFDPLPGQLNPERNITITGAPAAVETAKKLVNKICEDGKVPENLLAAPNQPGEFVIEHLVPASKVGLIIGKGGETIRNLQERAGCRMVMIQDGEFQTAPEKPLRITGDPQKCQYGKQLVVDLLTEKELEMEGRGQIKPAMDFKGRGGQNFGGMDRRSGPTSEVPVPRDVVGFVIGKGGDTIKRIQQETGCKVQFTMPDPGVGPDRMCILQGDPQQVQDATQKIREIIDSSRSRGPPHSRGPPANAPGVRTIEMPVPSNKCGIVIGKGGETIRQINQITGAHVEINKNTSDNPTVKHFVIRGNDSQIQHVQQLIREKIGEQGGNFQGQQMGQNQPGMQQQQWGGYGGYNAYGQQQQPQGQYGQQPQQHFAQQQQQGWQPYGQQYQQSAQQQSGAHQAVPGQTPGQPAAGQQDYSAAWAAYYQQYYQQYGQQAGAAPATSTAAAAAAAAAPAAVNPAQAGATAVASSASGMPAQGSSGQPDYSAAWAAYYQQMYPGYQGNAQAQQPQPAQAAQGQAPRG